MDSSNNKLKILYCELYFDETYVYNLKEKYDKLSKNDKEIIQKCLKKKLKYKVNELLNCKNLYVVDYISNIKYESIVKNINSFKTIIDLYNKYYNDKEYVKCIILYMKFKNNRLFYTLKLEESYYHLFCISCNSICEKIKVNSDLKVVICNIFCIHLSKYKYYCKCNY